MAILISCVGGSDPIRSGYDGPILHILRNYSDIDECLIFFSKETYKIHNDKNKNYYNRAIEMFSSETKRNIVLKEVEMNVEKANDFDIYFNIFYENLKSFFMNQTEKKKYYLNLTSGTPQMQTSLALVGQQFVYKDISFIQVDNFEFDSKNRSVDSFSANYDFLSETELYSIQDQSKNRCNELKLNSIARNNFLEQIKVMINSYDYSSVEIIFKDYFNENVKVRSLVLFSKYRQEMDYEKANNILVTNKIKNSLFMPMYSSLERRNEIFEYFLQIENVYKNENFNDFIIRLDLFTIEVMLEILYKKNNFDIRKFKKGKKFSLDLVFEVDPDLYSYIKENYYIDNYVNISLLNLILKYYYDKDNNEFDNSVGFNKQTILDFFDKMEKLHNLRNDSAHTLSIIKQIDIDSIILCKKIIEMYKKILKYIYPEIKDIYFESYNKVNEEILKLIK